MIAPLSQPLEFMTPAQADRHIAATTETALATSKYSSLRKLQCQARDGVVEISGTVPSFYLKQLAQTAVQQLHPGLTIRNLVVVQV